MRWVILLLLMAAFLFGCARQCKDYQYTECPKECVVCPACEYCSSVSCQSEESCQSLGFNRSWWQGIEERLNSS